MIDVKSFRPQGSATDPADPMALKADAENGTRLLSGIVVGLGALALYLKSFLAPSSLLAAETAEEPDEPQGALSDTLGVEGDPGALAVRTVAGQPEKTSKPQAPEKVADDSPVSLTAVFGPFETEVLAPGAVAALSIGLLGRAANAALPPFGAVSGPNVISGNGAMPQADLAEFTTAPFEGAPPVSPGVPAADAADSTDGQGAFPDPAGADPVGRAPEEPAEPSGEDNLRNRSPRHTGPVHLGDVGSGATLAIALSHLLTQTTDPDGDALTVKDLRVEAGSLLATTSGWRFLADPDRLGEVTVTYVVSDGTHDVRQTALLNVVENMFTGSGGSDLITGTDGRDVILGKAGDDTLIGNGGRDIIRGDDGDDYIVGGAGDDTLWGGAGDDVIAGGAGNDWISGGAGDDRLYGGTGDDVIAGDEGDDLLDGGDGDDVLAGGTGNDVLLGGAGDDILRGEAGSDVLDGGDANDLLSGGEGADIVRGGEGDDHVIADDDAADDLYIGGAGHDTIDYASAIAPVTVDLAQGVAYGESVGHDSFEDFERYVGSTGDDTFIGGAGDATITGNGGTDHYGFSQGDVVETPVSRFAITDFGFDDLISIYATSQGWHIRKAQKSLEDRIEDFFEDATEDLGLDEPRLRFSHDWTEDYRLTLIEVDFDRDRTADLEIRLDGEVHLVIEHA
jgi:Ca2+-binding RTX toxin-like protein